MHPVAPRAVDLDTYATAHSRRLRRQMFAHVPLPALLFTGLALSVGTATATAIVVGVFLVEIVLASSVVLAGRWREDRRRAAGVYPSWSSLASRTVVRRATSHARPDSRELGEVRGRLVLTPGGFCWAPTAKVGNLRLAAAPVTWPVATQIEVRRVWGFAQRGLVRFTTKSGSDDIITVWRTRDLMRFIPT